MHRRPAAMRDGRNAVSYEADRPTNEAGGRRRRSGPADWTGAGRGDVPASQPTRDA